MELYWEENTGHGGLLLAGYRMVSYIVRTHGDLRLDPAAPSALRVVGIVDAQRILPNGVLDWPDHGLSTG